MALRHPCTTVIHVKHRHHHHHHHHHHATGRQATVLSNGLTCTTNSHGGRDGGGGWGGLGALAAGAGGLKRGGDALRRHRLRANAIGNGLLVCRAPGLGWSLTVTDCSGGGGEGRCSAGAEVREECGLPHGRPGSDQCHIVTQEREWQVSM